VRLNESIFLSNLGSAEYDLGVQVAVQRHQQAHAIAIELGADDLVALTHRALGIDYHAQESFDLARHHLAEALRLYQKLGQVDRETQLRQMMNRFGYPT